MYVKLFKLSTGLVEELVRRLGACGGTTENAEEPLPSHAHTSVSTTVSLLSTLCRGSPQITHVRYLNFSLYYYKKLLQLCNLNNYSCTYIK